MNQPRIVVRTFGPGTQGMWDRFVRVLAKSARRQCPRWVLDIQSLALAPMTSPLGLQHAVFNTQKLDAWATAVSRADIGDRMLLMDADTAILRPLDAVWDLEFDLGYTTKPKESRMPFNAGVFFLRVSTAVKIFIGAWAAENRRMNDDPQHHQVWRPCYGGINQAALGSLFHQHRHAGLRVQRLPCVEWNCEDESWSAFSPDRTRIVHYKGELQRALLAKRRPDEEMKPLIDIWKEIEASLVYATRCDASQGR